MAIHVSSRTKANVAGTTKRLAAACGLALGISGMCLITDAATAGADGLDATPMPPAVIDEDGTHNYDTSSHPVAPSWSPPLWGSYPESSSWSGSSSHPCCSR